MQSTQEKLSPLALHGFYQLLRLGCYLKLIPYDWDNERKLLKRTTKLGLGFFNFHKNSMYFYCCSNILRTIKTYKTEGEFPMPIMLVTASWIHGEVLTSIVFSQFRKFRNEIMNFGNMLLKIIRNQSESKSESKQYSFQENF